MYEPACKNNPNLSQKNHITIPWLFRILLIYVQGTTAWFSDVCYIISPVLITYYRLERRSRHRNSLTWRSAANNIFKILGSARPSPSGGISCSRSAIFPCFPPINSVPRCQELNFFDRTPHRDTTVSGIFLGDFFPDEYLISKNCAILNYAIGEMDVVIQ